MSSGITFKIFDSAAIILKLVGVQSFMTIPNLPFIRSLEIKFWTYGQNKVIIGFKVEIILKS